MVSILYHYCTINNNTVDRFCIGFERLSDLRGQIAMLETVGQFLTDYSRLSVLTGSVLRGSTVLTKYVLNRSTTLKIHGA